jgi:hypothetical protein
LDLSPASVTCFLSLDSLLLPNSGTVPYFPPLESETSSQTLDLSFASQLLTYLSHKSVACLSSLQTCLLLPTRGSNNCFPSPGFVVRF